MLLLRLLLSERRMMVAKMLRRIVCPVERLSRLGKISIPSDFLTNFRRESPLFLLFNRNSTSSFRIFERMVSILTLLCRRRFLFGRLSLAWNCQLASGETSTKQSKNTSNSHTLFFSNPVSEINSFQSGPVNRFSIFMLSPRFSFFHSLSQCGYSKRLTGKKQWVLARKSLFKSHFASMREVFLLFPISVQSLESSPFSFMSPVLV